jgi:hypothetical protein
MDWTADTNYDTLGDKSVLAITEGRLSTEFRLSKLLPGVELSIRHPDGHTTKARIIAVGRDVAKIRLADRTKWHLTPFDPSVDLPTVKAPSERAQVWVVRKQIA